MCHHKQYLQVFFFTCSILFFTTVAMAQVIIEVRASDTPVFGILHKWYDTSLPREEQRKVNDIERMSLDGEISSEILSLHMLADNNETDNDRALQACEDLMADEKAPEIIRYWASLRRLERIRELPTVDKEATQWIDEHPGDPMIYGIRSMLAKRYGSNPKMEWSFEDYNPIIKDVVRWLDPVMRDPNPYSRDVVDCLDLYGDLMENLYYRQSTVWPQDDTQDANSNVAQWIIYLDSGQYVLDNLPLAIAPWNKALKILEQCSVNPNIVSDPELTSEEIEKRMKKINNSLNAIEKKTDLIVEMIAQTKKDIEDSKTRRTSFTREEAPEYLAKLRDMEALADPDARAYGKVVGDILEKHINDKAPWDYDAFHNDYLAAQLEQGILSAETPGKNPRIEEELETSTGALIGSATGATK